jgi:hypothetical protein
MTDQRQEYLFSDRHAAYRRAVADLSPAEELKFCHFLTGFIWTYVPPDKWMDALDASREVALGGRKVWPEKAHSLGDEGSPRREPADIESGAAGSPNKRTPLRSGKDAAAGPDK